MNIIDINCDYGESFGRYTIGNDKKILDYVTSVNIACGFHAGDPVLMEKSVKMAIKKGVAIGAHPGYPDLIGFGRREMKISHEEARAYMIYQISALKGFVESYGGKLQHVKPHGALYNSASKDIELAKTLAKAVYDVDKNLIFMGLSNSKMILAAKEIGLKVAQEVFADRAYNTDGTLVSRSIEGAVLHNPEDIASRALLMVKEGIVYSINGEKINITADSICVHGDNEKALEIAMILNKYLLSNNINLTSLK